MTQYNNYSSVCDVCYNKGFHIQPTKCVREQWHGCKNCGSHEHIDKLVPCTGTNIMIDYSAIAKKFSVYYGTDTRIKVGFVSKEGDIYETKTGTVSMTTGWKPMLMLRKNSIGSSYLLTDKDVIL